MAKKILLVEDDKFLSSILKTKLIQAGFEVIGAMDGEEAIKMFSQKPDLVLLDLILPKKSGFDVLESISQDPELEKIPVIIISNLGQNEDIERTKQLGAIEYYIKAKTPIDFLIKRVDDLLKA
jgi:DNA-binding response OmpR family regulator